MSTPKLGPFLVECPLCRQQVEIFSNNRTGRQHVLDHIRPFYRFLKHQDGGKLCDGSDIPPPIFIPRPKEREDVTFKLPPLPDTLEELKHQPQRAAGVSSEDPQLVSA